MFFGRAASVETCECRARLTDRRDGAGRFARRPAAAQYERPVGSPAGFVARRPMGRGAARPSTRFRLWVIALVRAAAAAPVLIASHRVWSAKLAVSSAVFFRAAVLPEPRFRLPSLQQVRGIFCLCR